MLTPGTPTLPGPIPVLGASDVTPYGAAVPLSVPQHRQQFPVSQKTTTLPYKSGGNF